jgi:hypothetical protein
MLRRIDERDLTPLLSQKHITMEGLMDLNHADIHDEGINTQSQRHKILAEVTRLKRGNCIEVFQCKF